MSKPEFHWVGSISAEDPTGTATYRVAEKEFSVHLPAFHVAKSIADLLEEAYYVGSQEGALLVADTVRRSLPVPPRMPVMQKVHDPRRWRHKCKDRDGDWRSFAGHITECPGCGVKK